MTKASPLLDIDPVQRHVRQVIEQAKTLLKDQKTLDKLGVNLDSSEKTRDK